ncbi:class I SAM-dependent methyltransferase [Gemmatimonadota bacterium]
MLCYSKFPLIADTVTNDKHELISKRYRFSIAICPGCNWIQQASEPDLSLLYRRFKNARLGSIWREHHKKLKEFIVKYLIGTTGSRIAEIGGGDLELARVIKVEVPDIELRVFENSLPEGVETEKLLLEKKLWEDAYVSQPFNLIYSSHVIEHVPDPRVHISKIRDNLETGGHCIVSLPDFQHWIENLYLNAFNQEHLIYPFITDIIEAFGRYGLTIDNIYRFENHSVFLAFENSEKTSMTGKQEPTSFEVKRRLLKEFEQYLARINSGLKQKCAGKKTFVFGANSSTQVLMSLPVMREVKVEAILDNSELKQGQYLAGSGIPVRNPVLLKDLEDAASCVVVIFMGAYTNEICQQINSLNPDLEIISPEDV